MDRTKENPEDTLKFDPVVRKLWEEGESPEDWADRTAPKDSLIYKDGHPSQIKDLTAMGHILGMPVRVVGSHRSKSVQLPVGMFFTDALMEEGVAMFTRNNFYNLKLVVVSSAPIHMPYELVHTLMTAVELEAEKRKAYDYRKDHRDFNPKDYEDDTWFHSWCSDTLLRTEDGGIYRCGATASCYYEGIDDLPLKDVFQRYEKGARRFAVEINGTTLQLMSLMENILKSAQKFVMERREDDRAVEFLRDFEAKPKTDEYSLSRALEARKWLGSRGVAV